MTTQPPAPLLSDDEKFLLVNIMEYFLGDYEDQFIWKDADISWAEYEGFRKEYSAALKLYYVFTGKDYWGSHGYMTNYEGRAE